MNGYEQLAKVAWLTLRAWDWLQVSTELRWSVVTDQQHSKGSTFHMAPPVAAVLQNSPVTAYTVPIPQRRATLPVYHQPSASPEGELGLPLPPAPAEWYYG